MRAVRKIVFLASIVAAAGGAGSAGMAAEIGAVQQRAYNGALGTPPGESERKLLFNNDIYAEETVATDAAATTSLQFLDSTRLKVGTSSTVVLDRFVYDPDTQTGAIAITFGKGIFRFVTGAIKNKEAIVLKTPTATMSVRGTDATVEVRDDNTTLVYVHDGAVPIDPCGGEPVEPQSGQTAIVAGDCSGTQVVDGDQTRGDPGVADGSPAFNRGPVNNDGNDTSASPNKRF
jgi:FecR protein